MNTKTIVRIGAGLAAVLLLAGCAGTRLGPGTSTGLLIGGAASIISGDGGRAAGIGAAAGAAVDILNGQPPVEVEPVYRDRYYRDDRYYRPAPPVYRPVPQRPPRRFYDERCGCYYYR